MKIRCREQERASPHQPPPLIWGRHQAPAASPKPRVSGGGLGVLSRPSEQTFQHCFCLCICWWDHPAHVFCPPTRASSGRGCAGPMAAVSEEDTLLFLLVVHLETPLRRRRLYCPCTVKTLSQLLCFFLVVFLKNILLYSYSSPSFKLWTFVPT